MKVVFGRGALFWIILHEAKGCLSDRFGVFSDNLNTHLTIIVDCLDQQIIQNLVRYGTNRRDPALNIEWLKGLAAISSHEGWLITQRKPKY
ncbi:hypothetical protein SUGI_0238980 [Cryptomeria japonica]|nr:hypothetical protein SUGI_0238980 [Cryptomeria japonica]